MNKKELITGNILGTLMNLSWPIIVGMLFQTGFNIVDTIFVGRLGEMALAAMTMSFPVIFFLISLAGGTAIGVNSLISRYLGADRKKEADNVAEHGLLLAFVMYFIFVMVGLFFSKRIFMLLGAEGELLDMILSYTNVIFIGSIFMLLMFVCNHIMRAEGDTKTPMKLLATSAIINIILDPVFIFGFWFIPAMGIQGAAIATIIARTIAAILSLNHIVFSNKSYIRLNWKYFRFRWSIVRKIYAVGFPASLSQMIMSLGILFFNSLFLSFGTAAVAAFGLYFRLESLAVMPLIGMMSGVITMTGHNFGAKKFKRIDRIVLLSSRMAVAFMISIGSLLILFPRFWLMIFTNDVNVISTGINFLRIIPFSLLLIGAGMMINGAFQGMGKGLFPLLFNVLRTFGLTLPIAYLLAFYFNFGLKGSLWSFPISSLIMSSVAIFWYCCGPWKKKAFDVKADT